MPFLALVQGSQEQQEPTQSRLEAGNGSVHVRPPCGNDMMWFEHSERSYSN